MHRRLVKVHETTLKREKNTALSLVRTSHASERRVGFEVAGNGDLSASDGFHQP